MPSIAAVYNPLITAARNNDPVGHRLLQETGAAIHAANPGHCQTDEAGINAAKRNLDYYVQYFDAEVAAQVKTFYGLGAGFRDLSGSKHAFA